MDDDTPPHAPTDIEAIMSIAVAAEEAAMAAKFAALSLMKVLDQRALTKPTVH